MLLGLKFVNSMHEILNPILEIWPYSFWQNRSKADLFYQHRPKTYRFWQHWPNHIHFDLSKQSRHMYSKIMYQLRYTWRYVIWTLKNGIFTKEKCNHHITFVINSRMWLFLYISRNTQIWSRFDYVSHICFIKSPNTPCRAVQLLEVQYQDPRLAVRTNSTGCNTTLSLVSQRKNWLQYSITVDQP